MTALLVFLLACQDGTGIRLQIESPEKILRPEGKMTLRFLLENTGTAELSLEEPASWTAGLEITGPDGTSVKTAEASKGALRAVPPGGFYGRAVDIGSVLKVPEDREGWYRFRWAHAGAKSPELRVLVLRDWIAAIDTTLGTIRIDFRPDLAPEHVLNFCRLARQGFYEGSTFHRIIPGFMMQGGLPRNPAGDPGPALRAEFSAVKHVFGTVSAARTGDPHSATSQFFICFAPASHLDGQYSVFGGLVDGHDVVKLAEKAKSDHNPCKGCGRVPARPGSVSGCCGAHHEDRPETDIVIKKVSLSIRKS